MVFQVLSVKYISVYAVLTFLTCAFSNAPIIGNAKTTPIIPPTIVQAPQTVNENVGVKLKMKIPFTTPAK